MKALNHLDPDGVKPETFQYDTIEALRLIMANRSAESEKERKALANCLAEVLPTHLDFFPLEDLADLVPFLRPSKYVPSAVFLQNSKSATRKDLTEVALLQIVTCKGKPCQTGSLVSACVNTTRWLFEEPRALASIPEKQPLDLIRVSKPVHRRHSRGQPTSQMWRALKADEVVWGDIERAFAAFQSTDHGTNNSRNLNAQGISDGP
ncbi:hypothetical protein H0H92_007113 [Tricholoma furcatifolium]|nr:hypothetical protein H0H92_007113 [Tricholoma furcatifolium]